MSIPRIRNINTIETYQIPNVANVYIPRWMTTQPNVDYLLPPVVVNIGNPIIDIPGCVKAHKDNKIHKHNIPIDKDLVENDDGNAMTLCPDGSYPHYDAMNYEPEQLIMTYEQKPPVVPPPPEPDLNTPETPSIPKTDEEVECPPLNARRIGDLSQNGKERVKEYKLTPDGKICETIWEDVPAIDAYLPAVNVVTTTASIAAVATTSALLAKPLADLLLKVVKPLVKKTIAKVKEKVLGKKPPVLSLRERILKQKEANAAVKAARQLKGK